MSCRQATLTLTPRTMEDRKSTRLNSSHANISYAVFCLKKKKITIVKAISFQVEVPKIGEGSSYMLNDTLTLRGAISAKYRATTLLFDELSTNPNVAQDR